MLQAILKVIGGKNDGKLIEFRGSKFLVGREQDCHLRPNSDLVSRHHCVFTVDDYALRLRDLGSTNGTLVNGRRIKGETVLTPGDVVKIGKLNLEVVIGDAKAVESNAPAPASGFETTTNASAMDTAHELPQHTTLEDSGMIAASPTSDTVQIQLPAEGADSAEEIAAPETAPAVSESSSQQTVDPTTAAPNQPVQPAPGQPVYPPGMDPQYIPNGWQYPQYPPQYPQFPPGYYPPGSGYPPQGQYPPNYPPPGQTPAPPPDQGSSAEIPQVRLPDPSETGVREEAPKANDSQSEPKKSQQDTPSQRAADLINSSRTRRRSEE